MAERRLRVLLGKIGLDGHDRGIRMIAAWLRDSGMEVVYIGTHQTPAGVAQATIEEDTDGIGLSFLGADHVPLVRLMVEEMRKEHLGDRLLVVGGNIPKRDIAVLKEMGVDEVFPSGTPMTVCVEYIRENARRKREAEGA